MSEFRLAGEARLDLEEIWLYIARDNPEAADRLNRNIIQKFPFLAANPEVGRNRPELAPRLRSFPVNNYIIFFRPMENGIEIVRVLHGARDIPALFE